MGNKITLIFVLLFVFAGSSNGHPLGNFSFNNYSRIEVGENKISLRCISDMAEIPTFQESQQIDTNKNNALEAEELASYLEKATAQYISNLKLSVDGSPLQIQVAAKNISLVTGAGNLPTLRIEWGFTSEFSAPAKDAVYRLRFENDNYRERVGWNEIFVNHVAGTSVFNSTAFGSGVTDELKTYPEDMLSTPLSEREAEFSFTASAVVINEALPLQNRNGSVSAPVQKDRFAELISVPEITPAIIAIGLLLAFGFGAMHALSPGHGKTVVGAYLVGSKGTIKHAAFLGLTVTITHTLGVFAIGLITLFASKFIQPERLVPILGFASGLIVLFIGLSLFKNRLFTWLGYENQTDHKHDHDSGEDDHHHDQHDQFTHSHDGHTHSHLPPEKVTWGSLLALGISGGLLPCPSALVLMLSAISFNRIGYGLVLTVAFSFGLAATLMVIGLTFLYVGKLLDSPSLGNNPIIKALPVFSAFVITCVGAAICYNSLA